MPDALRLRDDPGRNGVVERDVRLGWYVGNQGLGIVEPVGGLFTHDFCQRLIALLTRRDESDIEFGAQRTGQSAAQADCVRPAVVGQVRDEDSHVSKLAVVRLVVAECQVDYAGRLTAHLPMARRLLLIKSDGSVSVHADDRAYKPLNWMSPPCWLTEEACPTMMRPRRSGSSLTRPANSCGSRLPRSSTIPPTNWGSIQAS